MLVTGPHLDTLFALLQHPASSSWMRHVSGSSSDMSMQSRSSILLANFGGTGNCNVGISGFRWRPRSAAVSGKRLWVGIGAVVEKTGSVAIVTVVLVVSAPGWRVAAKVGSSQGLCTYTIPLS